MNQRLIQESNDTNFTLSCSNVLRMTRLCTFNLLLVSTSDLSYPQKKTQHIYCRLKVSTKLLAATEVCTPIPWMLFPAFSLSTVLRYGTITFQVSLNLSKNDSRGSIIYVSSDHDLIFRLVIFRNAQSHFPKNI